MKIRDSCVNVIDKTTKTRLLSELTDAGQTAKSVEVQTFVTRLHLSKQQRPFGTYLIGSGILRHQNHNVTRTQYQYW